MNKHTFHLVTLAHLPQSSEYMSCAFTQKNRKLAKMLTSLGHTVYFYCSEGSDIIDYCQSENLHVITTHALSDIRRDYGDGNNFFSIGYDWKNSDFRHDFNTVKKPSTLKFYQSCIVAINNIKKPDHFLLLTQGVYHSPIADEVNLFLTCEPGVGYRGSIKGRFRAFESSYIQNFTYGSEAPYQSINGSYYDRVIPNYFDPEDILFSAKKKNYYLFIGRMIKRKGIMTAALACNAIGKKLIIAGQGAHVDGRGYLVPNEDPDFELAPSTWEYVGYVDVEKRKKLMAHAIATFTPTEYLECFAGTHVESMLSGTPPITTNFGVFAETIPDYLNCEVGYKCNTLQDFVNAAISASKPGHHLKADKISEYANRFSIDFVKSEFHKWFDDLYQVYLSTDGKTPGWHFLKQKTTIKK